MIRAATWRILLALVAIFDLEIEQMDVKGAFLHGVIDEEVYMEMPDGWELFPEFFTKEVLLLLLKALYGLKQSPRLWQLTLKKELAKLGFFELFADQSVYRNPITGLILATYVDDFLLIGP